MEPLTALGLAANVAQFLGYGIKLIATAREVHSSADGTTQQIATLDTVYSKLGALSTSLKRPSQSPGKMGWDALTHEKSIQSIARVCQDDCDTLLELTKQLKSDEGRSSFFSSFRAALRAMRKSKQINDLEQRLHRTQQTLTLHISSLASIWQSTCTDQLSKLKNEQKTLAFHQTSKLIQIQREVEQLGRNWRNETSPSRNASPSDITGLEQDMGRLSIARAELEKQHAIIRSLDFEGRSYRFEAITEAGENTFRWVLEEMENLDTELASGSMLEWLRQGQGIYWVSGKPGSGKSTLMKFVNSQSKTADSLAIWSSGKRLVTGHHYFWAAGTAMQKSRKGLLRTLLFDILRQQPDLVKQLCPERWMQSPDQLSLISDDWGASELIRTLQRVPSLSDMATNFCFFIDGLDEYEGDHVEICKILEELTKSPSVKVCVESRPWNDFENAFGLSAASKMYVHEFTRQDIHAYVELALSQHPRWDEVKMKSVKAVSLVDRVTERSAGVFLWVWLATRELRSGLSEYDSFSELEQRLETIPDDLEAFFRQILETVDKFHHQAMAEALLLSLAVREPASTTVYYYLDKDRSDQDYALKVPVRPWSSEEEYANQELTARRLNAKCRGLLQVNNLSSCLEPLHRTVLDYLRTQDMTEFLNVRARRTFNVHLLATRAFIACIKSIVFVHRPRRAGFACYADNEFTRTLQEALFHSKQLEEGSGVYCLLEHLETSISEMNKTGQCFVSDYGDPTDTDALFMREMVISEFHDGYVDFMIRRDPNYLSDFTKPVMGEVLGLLSRLSLRSNMGWIPLVKVLIDHEFDPNRPYSIENALTTPWRFVLTRCFFRDFPDSVILNPILESGLLHPMLANGADPYLLLDGDRLNHHFFKSSTDSVGPAWLPNTNPPKPWLCYFIDCLIANRPTIKVMTCATQVLNQTITAFNTRLQNCERAVEGYGILGDTQVFLDNLALDDLLKRLPHNCGEPALAFWVEVAEKLITIAQLHKIETDGFFPILQLKFPRHPFSFTAQGEPSLSAGSGLLCTNPVSTKRTLPWADEDHDHRGKQQRT